MTASGPGWRDDVQLPGREDGAHRDGRGASQTALDLTTAHCGERKAFGGHLSDLGAIRQRLAMRQAEVANRVMYDCLQFHGGMG